MSAYDAFARIYDRWSAGVANDIPFYIELAREADGPVVELAVGTGRVAIPVAQTLGRRVIGTDTSREMLAKARATADKAGVELDLREQDMRDFDLNELAALVYSPFRSLLHLPSWSDRRRVFERVAAALMRGGRFAWNAFVFDYRIATQSEGRNEEPVPHDVAHFPADNRLDITLVDGGARISLWWVTRSEWEALIDVAGLEVEALYGGFDKRPFDEESREFVWIARKP
jgi:SAM-dependent methyltransferase